MKLIMYVTTDENEGLSGPVEIPLIEGGTLDGDLELKITEAVSDIWMDAERK